jgi:hypothetical protein
VTRIKTSQVVELPSDARPRLVLSGSHEFAAGQIITAAPGPDAPEGFLLRIRSSEVSGDETTVEVQPASLYEAMPEGSLVASTADFSVDSLHSKADVVAEGHHVLARLATEPADDPGSQTVPFDKLLKCKSSQAVSLSGRVRTTLEPHFDLSWDRDGLRTSIRTASVRVDGGVSVDAEARAEGNASCKLDTVLLKPSWIAFIPIGPVVVPVTFGLPIRLLASASASGEIRISTGVGAHSSLGIEYDEGAAHPIHIFDYDPPYIEPAIEAAASARAIVGPEVTVKAGWHVPALGGLAATAGVGIYSGISYSYDISRDPPGKTCVPLELTGTIGFQLPFRRKPHSWPIPIFKEDLDCSPPDTGAVHG